MKKSIGRWLRSLTLLLFTLSVKNLGAQLVCPSNIDFEAGSFQNWDCFLGTTTSNGAQNFVNVSTSTPTPTRHTLYSQADAGTLDPYGAFPVLCPNGSGYSVKLGNSGSGRLAERISYTFTIPAGQVEYSIVYQYAVVLEDPRHRPEEQPRFIARVFDVTSGDYVQCATFNHVASGNIPGFLNSTVAGGRDVRYKPWSAVTINLSGYAGKTIALEFTTADCTLGAHFGYAYLDVNIGCSSPVAGAMFCPGANSVTMTAPFGYQAYNWYSLDYSQLLGSGSTITISPAPSVNTSYALEIIPYDDLGCRDTIVAVVRQGTSPTVEGGPDKTICQYDSVSIGLPAVPGNSYAWTPAGGLGSVTAAVTMASPADSRLYYITATDLQSGCTAKDSVLVTVNKPPSPMFTVGNGTAQCINVNSFNLRYPNPDNATFNWYMGDGRTYNTTNINHTYARPDTYRVRLVATSPQGCVDSARVDLTVHPQPSGSITASDLRICEGTPAVLTATGGVRYDWYRNNTLIPNAIASTYNALLAGTYTMEVTDANGCKNAGTNSVSFDVVAKPTADFLFDRYCIDLPVQFTNRSNSAASGAVTYLWDFGDGNTSTLREPAFTFSKEGAQNVKLSVTPTFCPQLVTTVQKEIRVEKPVPGMHYTPLNALTNRQLNLKARSLGVSGYTWNPSTFLNSATSANPVFYGNREQQYTVTYNTISGCTTVDTLLVRIFNEREIYVPTAFSPNGDGNNDRMYPFLVGISELKVFRIMNRWGVVVYEAKTDLPGWDGTFRGAPQPVGAYVWEAMGVDVAGATLVRKGTFTLIR